MSRPVFKTATRGLRGGKRGPHAVNAPRRPWLSAPVVMFEGRSPLELIKAGEAHRIMRALASHDSGVIE